MSLVDFHVGDALFLHFPIPNVTVVGRVKRLHYHALLGKGWDIEIALPRANRCERTVYAVELEPVLVYDVWVFQLIS
jgi:hypothetical protein